MSLGVANTAVAITIDGVVNNLVTDANGKVQVSGCEAGTVQARSFAALSGTIKIEGYCETSFSASGSSGSEISITLILSKGTPKSQSLKNSKFNFAFFSDCQDWFGQHCCSCYHGWHQD